MRDKAVIAVGFLFLGTALPAFSSSFTNGSFESPGGAPIRLFLGNDDPFVTGWINNASATTGQEVYESSGQDGIPAGSGTYYVSFGLGDSSGGTLQQTFDTVAGDTYAVTYLLATQQTGALVFQSNSVAAYNGNVLTPPNLLNSVTNTFFPNFVWFSGTTLHFNATGTSTTLIFTDTTPQGESVFSNWGLDAVSVAVSVSGVPEPCSLGLLALGLFAITLVRVRRSMR